MLLRLLRLSSASRIGASETHVLVPREPIPLQLQDGSEIDLAEETPDAYQEFLRDIYLAMIAAAPQPEPVESEPVMEAILCVSANGLETAWRQKESSWWSAVEPIQKIKLYTTPQPDRTDRVRELEEENARLNSEIEMLKSGKRSNIRLGMEIAALKAESENLKRDAERWRAYQKRKQDLLDRGFLRSPLREEAELNPAMAQGEKK